MRRRDVAKELDGPVARRLLSGAIPARFAYLALDVTPRAIPDTAERGSGTRGETTEVTLLLVAFVPGGSWGVPGIDPDEVQRMFATAWMLLS